MNHKAVSTAYHNSMVKTRIGLLVQGNIRLNWLVLSNFFLQLLLALDVPRFYIPNRSLWLQFDYDFKESLKNLTLLLWVKKGS